MQVVGLVTRKDLTEPNAKLVLGRKANLGLASGSTDALVHDEGLPFIPYGKKSHAFTLRPERSLFSYHLIIKLASKNVNPERSPITQELSDWVLPSTVGAYDPTVGSHGAVRQGRGFRHLMAHPDLERGRAQSRPSQVCKHSTCMIHMCAAQARATAYRILLRFNQCCDYGRKGRCLTIGQ